VIDAPSTATPIGGGRFSALRLPEKTVIVSVELHLPSARRKVDPRRVLKRGEAAGEAEADEADGGGVDPNWLSVSKRLLDSPEWRAVRAYDCEIRRFVGRKSVCTLLRGFALVALGEVAAIDARLAEMFDERRRLSQAYMISYPEKVKAAKESLGDLFDPEEYPPAERMGQAFTQSVRYVSFATPESLKGVSRELFAREADKVNRLWSQAAEEVVLALRQGALQVFESLSAKLGTQANGAKAQLKGNAMEKIFTFLESFQARNVTDDRALAALVQQARAALEGVDLKTLRTKNDVRATVKAQFDGLATAAKALAEEPPQRLISFDDDD
jgi:hypothetical protein